METNRRSFFASIAAIAIGSRAKASSLPRAVFTHDLLTPSVALAASQAKDDLQRVLNTYAPQLGASKFRAAIEKESRSISTLIDHRYQERAVLS